MPDDTFGRVADEDLLNIIETTSRENDAERPYTWDLIRGALLELQQHRARIAAHAAAHPERLSDEVIDGIAGALKQEGRGLESIFMPEEPMTIITEIQQRRAADLTVTEQIAAFIERVSLEWEHIPQVADALAGVAGRVRRGEATS